MLKVTLASLLVTSLLACSIDYAIWMPRSESADPLYRFVRHEKAGYIDRSGRVIVKPQFRSYGNYGFEFHEGLLSLDGGRYARIDGTVFSVPGLQSSRDFTEGLAVAARDRMFGFIDKAGKFAITPQFQSASSFSEGLAIVKANGKYGYINHSGKYVIPPKYPFADNFKDGFALVVEEGPCVYFDEGGCGGPIPVGQAGFKSLMPCQFAFIDKSGNAITALRFPSAHGFSEGIAPVQVGDLWGFLNRFGQFSITPKFHSAKPFHSGLSRVGVRRGTDKDLLYGFADRSGNLVIPATFDYADDFSDGFAVVGDGPTNLWYIDRKGDRAFPGAFWVASGFFKGLAHVRMAPNGDKSQRLREAYIDTKGKPVFQYRSDARNYYQ